MVHDIHAPHISLPLQVIEEAEHGKLYVRGHDREGRPIIHYSPGLEISFDTEKVRRRCWAAA